ncbi:FecR family protein [Delftia acidovorans]|uniref:FecR family protein n=1 Tax=Delftia acidovorans TaxID=80866 RepID=UPI000BCE6DE6|nr:FecR domain-containing protein [Delftia acidovorans]SOE34068.1 FecR family protein [Delftia acidovorans]
MRRYRSCTAPLDKAAQVRELEEFFRGQNPIDLAAADWHTRMEQGLTAEEEAEFTEWLAASTAHEAALRHLGQSLAAARSIPPEQVARLRAEQARRRSQSAPHAHPEPAAQRPSSEERQGWSWSRLLPRPALAALCCTVALTLAVGVGWHQWQQQPTFTSSHLTPRGQARTITLPEGTALSLDADTQAQVALYRDRREVRITQGQILFAVAPDSARPFHVLAGPARVTVGGTRFSVRYRATGMEAGSAQVAVQEGHVRVAGAQGAVAADAAPADLVAGQALSVSPAGVLGPVSAVAPGSIALWRKGLIRFENTPLADALAELERYGPTGLVVHDPAVAALRIGGTYQASRPAEFARMLAQILPVTLVAGPDGQTEIAAAP